LRKRGTGGSSQVCFPPSPAVAVAVGLTRAADLHLGPNELVPRDAIVAEFAAVKLGGTVVKLQV